LTWRLLKHIVVKISSEFIHLAFH